MKLTAENTENTEQDTPETDGQPYIMALNDEGYQVPCVDIEFARKLQRERDEALSQIYQAEGRAERFCQERDKARELLTAAQNALDAIHLEVASWIEKLKESK